MTSIQIVIRDERPPFTSTIALAKSRRDPSLDVWENDLAEFTGECCRKFHGSLTHQMVDDGLRTAVGILDLGLMASTDGLPDPEAWLILLRSVVPVKHCGCIASLLLRDIYM